MKFLTTIKLVLIAFALGSVSTGLAFQWSDWHLTQASKEALSILDLSDQALGLVRQISELPQQYKSLGILVVKPINQAQQQRVLGQVIESGIMDQESGNEIAPQSIQQITHVIKEINNYTVQASLNESELINLISSSQTLKALLKGDKGDPGPGAPVSYTLPTSSNTSSMGSIGGFTHLSGNDLTTQNLSVTNNAIFSTITVTNLTTSGTTTINSLVGPLIIGGTTANASSILELSSTTKGFLPPRLTTIQRDAVSSPATGLLVYNNNTNQLNVYNGTSWTTAGISKWSELTAPDANLSLAMAANTTTLTWNAATGASSLFNLTDTNSNTGTGYLLNVTTGTSSTLKPFHVSAAGSEALTILANANVGIGTTAPTGLLHVRTTSNSFSATGGTITTSGGYTIHTFTSSGTFTPNGAVNVEYLVVAGGGGGGGTQGGWTPGGGGGAGGVLTGSGYAVTAQAYTVTVGAGGAGGATENSNGSNGSNSVFATITAVGGGGGGAAGQVGVTGGSGGGSSNGAGAAGTSGQGNAGGSGAGSVHGAGGGGGATAVGTNGPAGTGIGATGGAGLTSSISGTSVTYGGGGGGGGFDAAGGAGGSGGGGAGGSNVSGAGTAGTANLGGGGGGAGDGGGIDPGGSGGSGVVIVRYLTPNVATDSIFVSSTNSNVGIGTTAPASLLHVYSSVGAGGAPSYMLSIDSISSTAGTTANNALIRFFHNNGNNSRTWYAGTGISGAMNDSFVIQDGSNTRFAINTSGNASFGGYAAAGGAGSVIIGNENSITGSGDSGVGYIQGPSGNYLRIEGQGNGVIKSLTIWNNAGSGSAVNVDSSGILYRVSSALKYKKNVKDLEGGLSEVLQLRPVTYEEKARPEAGIFVGFIADEVVNVFPELVSYGLDGQIEGLMYDRLTGPIVNAIKELNNKITVLQNASGQITPDYSSTGISLSNIKDIVSISGKWSVDENGILIVKEVKTEKLCIGVTCVDEATLKSLLQNNGLLPQPQVAGENTSSQAEPTPEPPAEETVPELTPEPTPEPAP